MIQMKNSAGVQIAGRPIIRILNLPMIVVTLQIVLAVVHVECQVSIFSGHWTVASATL